MQRFLFFLFFSFFSIVFFSFGNHSNTFRSEVKSSASTLYTQLNLEEVVSFTAFEYALSGFESISTKQKDILTVIDFSKSSAEERLCVIDVAAQKLLFTSHVAHGRNSGEKYATLFSNQTGSYKSSLGFYLTENTYRGSNGYSLVLNGLEKNINDKAKERAIVMHGADYCHYSTVVNSGRLGRSFGCPALPPALNKPIIDTIKNGSVLFIYAENQEYFAQSTFFTREKQLATLY